MCAVDAWPQLSGGHKEGSRPIEAVPLVSLIYQASMTGEQCARIVRVMHDSIICPKGCCVCVSE